MPEFHYYEGWRIRSSLRGFHWECHNMLMAIFFGSGLVAVTVIIAAAVMEAHNPILTLTGVVAFCLAIVVAMHVLNRVPLDGLSFTRPSFRVGTVARSTDETHR
jgi:hypothetical protein